MLSIQALIFDLDGTLYYNPDLQKKQLEVAIGILQVHLDCSYNHAKKIFEETRSSLKKQFGYEPSNTYSITKIGIPLEKYLKESEKRYDAGSFLNKDKQLIEILNKFRQQFKLVLLTNNNKYQTYLMLNSLGIQDVWDIILTLSDTKIIKPDKRPYQQISKKLKVHPEQCIVIGDRKEIDLSPAKQIGMHTILVSGVFDVYKLRDKINKIIHNK